MTRILIPTRVRYGFDGGVGEVIRMLGTIAPDCGHSLIDLDGQAIPKSLPTRSRKFRSVLMRRLAHLRTLAFFDSALPCAHLVFFQTSLGRNSLLRDVAYMHKCRRSGRPFSVFIHGWDQQFVDRLSASPARTKKLAILLNHAKRILVLAPRFADTLAMWGVESRNVGVETTMIDDSMVAGFDIEEKIRSHARTQGLRILFLSRILKEKGIFQAIDAFQLHRKRFTSSTFVVAGEGRDLLAAKEKVDRESIRGVYFTGFVEGDEKLDLLARSDVFLFPSSYGEGLPVSLLEAMAFGNTIISRPVGGIGSLFRSPEMGYLEEGVDPARYAALLDRVAENPDSWVATARFNNEFSKQNTLASRVARRILDEVTTGLE